MDKDKGRIDNNILIFYPWIGYVATVCYFYSLKSSAIADSISPYCIFADLQAW